MFLGGEHSATLHLVTNTYTHDVGFLLCQPISCVCVFPYVFMFLCLPLFLKDSLITVDVMLAEGGAFTGGTLRTLEEDGSLLPATFDQVSFYTNGNIVRYILTFSPK